MQTSIVSVVLTFKWFCFRDRNQPSILHNQLDETVQLVPAQSRQQGEILVIIRRNGRVADRLTLFYAPQLRGHSFRFLLGSSCSVQIDHISHQAASSKRSAR
ncbi:hypothetical protein D9M72_538250 [compost metagenome]